MRFSRDRRGQSVVVGTVILFGFLIVALGIYQIQVVPTENANVEFEHSQTVEDDFGDLRNDVLRAGSTGSAGSTQIRLGTRYPPRTFFINPPPVSGSIATEDTGAIRVRNATLGGGVHPNAAAFWNTSPAFPTRSLRYDADYNELRGTPELVYEHSVVAAEFDDAVLLRSGQTAVSEGRISLTALTGSTSESGVQPRNVDVRAVSASDTTVPLEPTGGQITLDLPTAVDNATALATRWNDALPAGATATPNATGETIQIALANGSDPYRLALSEVSIDASGETEPAYVVSVGSESAAVGETVTVEVRDRYNNPIPDATVSFGGENRTTGDEGRAFFEPTASGTLVATINGSMGPAYESVAFDVRESGTASASRVLNVTWDEPSSVIDVPAGESRDIGVIVSNTSAGRITSATVDASYSGAAGNTGGQPTVSDPSVTDTNGETTVTFDSGDAEGGDRFELYAASGDDVDTISVNVIEPAGGPQFGEFTVSVTQTRGNSGNIQEVTASGTIFNPDPNGEVEIELLRNGNSEFIDQNQMTDPFSIPADGSNDQSYDIRLTLLDGDGNPISGQNCTSDTSVSDGNDLDQTDFTCN